MQLRFGTTLIGAYRNGSYRYTYTDDYTHFSGAAISEVANVIRTSIVVPFVLTSLSRRIVRARRPGASASSGSQLAMKPCEMFLWHCLRETLYGIRSIRHSLGANMFLFAWRLPSSSTTDSDVSRSRSGCT